jgi:hypothetical protein
MFEKTAQAVLRSRKQRKLFYVPENSASCSTFRENSASCSTFKKTAQAVHRNEYQQRQQQLGLFAVRDINAS